MTYAVDRVWEEIAYVAYHFHWSMDQILDLEHPTRHQIIHQIAQINERLNGLSRREG